MLSVGFYQWFKEHLFETPGNYLEIGVFDGEGLKMLADEYPHKHFYGIDPFIEDGNTVGYSGVSQGEYMEKMHRIALKNAQSAKGGNAFVFSSTSEESSKAIDDLWIKVAQIGTVYVDGNHSYENTLHDLRFACRLLPRGGVIGIDDLHLEGVKQAESQWSSEMGNKLANHPFPYYNPVTRTYVYRP